MRAIASDKWPEWRLLEVRPGFRIGRSEPEASAFLFLVVRNVLVSIFYQLGTIS